MSSQVQPGALQGPPGALQLGQDGLLGLHAPLLTHPQVGPPEVFHPSALAGTSALAGQVVVVMLVVGGGGLIPFNMFPSLSFFNFLCVFFRPYACPSSDSLCVRPCWLPLSSQTLLLLLPPTALGSEETQWLIGDLVVLSTAKDLISV